MTASDGAYCAQLAQFTSVTVPLEDDSLSEIVRTGARRLLRALRNGQYPPNAFDELVAEVNVERGIELDLTTTYNFHHSPLAVPDVADVDLPAYIDGVRGDTTFDWVDKLQHENYKMYLDSWVDDQLHLMLRVDTACLPAEGIEPLLRAMEDAVVRLSLGDVPLAALAGLASPVLSRDR